MKEIIGGGEEEPGGKLEESFELSHLMRMYDSDLKQARVKDL